MPPWASQPRRFTHVDPFEDTESLHPLTPGAPTHHVSPTSIRSRILKGTLPRFESAVKCCFTHVDPFEDTESFKGGQNFPR